MVAIRGAWLVVVVSALVGCGSSASNSSPPVGTYVGTVAGSNAFVAVVAGKQNVVVYVCDGQHGVSELFQGKRGAGTLSLRDTHGARVSVTIDRQSAKGSFSVAGGSQPASFVADPAQGRAGFYRATGRLHGTPASLGWVVLGDGRQRGSMTVAGRITAAPTLSVSSGTAVAQGVQISATRITPTSVSSTSFSGGGFSGFGG